MYRISETLRYPIGYVSYNSYYTPEESLILAANDFFCSGIVGYTAFLQGSSNGKISKVALETDLEQKSFDTKGYPISRYNVTGGAWCEAIENKEKNAFGLCDPELKNKYSAESGHYSKILKLVQEKIGYREHYKLLDEFVEAYPHKKDKVFCVLPKSMITICNLGSFVGTSEDYYLVKEVLSALSYIAAGCEMTNKCSVSLSAGRLLLEWRLVDNSNNNNDDDSEEWSYIDHWLERRRYNVVNNSVRATGYLASREYIEDAFSRILQHYSSRVSTEELGKFNVPNTYKGTVVTNFNLGIDSEHIHFNDFSFLNALSIVKNWEESTGVNLELDSLESDYYLARERAPYIDDPF